MNLRDRRLAIPFRLLTVVAMVAGVAFNAVGLGTLSGLLPYFTTQSNIAYGAFAGFAALMVWRGERVSAPLKGAVTLYVVITALVYHFVLANSASGFSVHFGERNTAAAIGNQLQHTVVPLMAVLDWLLFDTRGRFRWRHAFYWLAYPTGYLIFAVLRGLVVHKYPYPFLDANTLGYRGLAITSVFFAVAFWLLGLIFVLADRLLAGKLRRRSSRTPESGDTAPTDATPADVTPADAEPGGPAEVSTTPSTS